MFVTPALRAHSGPELSFLRTYNAHFGIAIVPGRVPLNRPIHHIADLNRSVLTGTEQTQRTDPCERTHFVMHLRSTVKKEALDRIQRCHGQFPEKAETESLSNRRVDAVENRVASGVFNPLRAAVGE